MRTYRIHGDALGARDFAELLSTLCARVTVRECDVWVDVTSNASDEAVHDAMCHAEWDLDRDGPVMEVLEPDR